MILAGKVNYYEMFRLFTPDRMIAVPCKLNSGVIEVSNSFPIYPTIHILAVFVFVYHFAHNAKRSDKGTTSRVISKYPMNDYDRANLIAAGAILVQLLLVVLVAVLS